MTCRLYLTPTDQTLSMMHMASEFGYPDGVFHSLGGGSTALMCARTASTWSRGAMGQRMRCWVRVRHGLSPASLMGPPVRQCDGTGWGVFRS